MLTVRLSSKGQVVIPSTLRAELHLESGTRFDVSIENGRLLLEPIRATEFDLEAIRAAVDKVGGMLYKTDQKKVSDEEMDVAVMKMLAEDDERIRRDE